MAPNSRAAQIREDLRQLRLNRPDALDAWEFLQTWPCHPGHEAAIALMAATLLEHALERAISTHFAVNREDADSIFLDQSEGGLSTFSMKIKLAYALGVIEKKVRKELTLIKTLRNEAARGAFSAPSTVTTCNHLFVWKELTFDAPAGAGMLSAKAKYAQSIEYIHAYLAGSVTEATERVPLLCEDSDFYCRAFLNQETYPRRFGKDFGFASAPED
jgi:DNA-binding MltR family transcriptional regulator